VDLAIRRRQPAVGAARGGQKAELPHRISAVVQDLHHLGADGAGRADDGHALAGGIEAAHVVVLVWCGSRPQWLQRHAGGSQPRRVRRIVVDQARAMT
jgi:hypothetical protein